MYVTAGRIDPSFFGVLGLGAQWNVAGRGVVCVVGASRLMGVVFRSRTIGGCLETEGSECGTGYLNEVVYVVDNV